MDQEVLVVANTDPANPCGVYVIVDLTLDNVGDTFRVLHSNQAQPAPTKASLVRWPCKKELAAAAVAR